MTKRTQKRRSRKATISIERSTNHKHHKNMNEQELLGRLQDIERKQIELSRQMQYERKVYQAELEERLRLGLQGDDAYKHYCDYMTAHGLKP